MRGLEMTGLLPWRESCYTSVLQFLTNYSDALFDTELVRWLIEHGADPNARCRYDITPLSVAAATASKEVIELLFELGASVRSKLTVRTKLSRSSWQRAPPLMQSCFMTTLCHSASSSV